MTEVLVRVAIAAALAAVVVVSVRLLAARRPTQGRITLSGFADVIVLFTSTDCSNCADARQAFKAAGVVVREITWELEGPVLEAAGVTEVPTAVVLGAAGETLDQVSGVPTARRVRRMAAMLGDGSGAGYRTAP